RGEGATIAWRGRTAAPGHADPAVRARRARRDGASGEPEDRDVRVVALRTPERDRRSRSRAACGRRGDEDLDRDRGRPALALGRVERQRVAVGILEPTDLLTARRCPDPARVLL